MSIFFTADHHFGHEAIIDYCQRPFKNATQMDRVLIKNHNEVVGDDDDVYFLGDFSLVRSRNPNYYRDLLSKLNGRKHLILGNHDQLKPFAYVDLGFWTVHTALRVYIEDLSVMLVHDPALAVLDREHWFLCGHIHELFVVQRNVINVGVDVCGYTPISSDRILETIKKYEEKRNG